VNHANAGEQVRTTTGTGTQGPRSKLAVFTIVEINEEKALWRRVGNAYLNRDGSYNLYLEALPVNGKLHMREHQEPPPPHGERS